MRWRSTVLLRGILESPYSGQGRGEVDDTFAIAELLLADDHDLIHKATGGWLREAGTKDRQRLMRFLGTHDARMPRTMLRYVIKHLDAAQRAHFLGLRQPG